MQERGQEGKEEGQDRSQEADEGLKSMMNLGKSLVVDENEEGEGMRRSRGGRKWMRTRK